LSKFAIYESCLWRKCDCVARKNAVVTKLK
jgi:hypothetical protein